MEIYNRLYDALKQISSYQSPAKLKKEAKRRYGITDASDAIEMAYENVIQEAKTAIRGIRRAEAK